MSKSLLVLGATVGSLVGGYLPALWGDDSGLSFVSLLFATVGGIVGIWLGYRFTQ